MIQKIKDLYSIYTNMVKVNSLTYWKLRSLRRKYKPIIVRKGSTDLHVFQQIFLYDDYKIGKLDFEPQFIIDAGAYAGYATLFFNNEYPDSQIVSIEPSDSNFPILEENTKKINLVKRYKAGLWHKESWIKIIDRKTGEWGFMIEEVAENEKHDLKTISVDQILIDTGWPYIDIFKIDIEGSEFELFTFNYESWISKVRVFIIEFHDRIKPGASDAFRKAIEPFEWEEFQRGENLIFIRKAFPVS